MEEKDCVHLCDSAESFDVSRDTVGVGSTLSTDISFITAAKCRLFLKVGKLSFNCTVNLSTLGLPCLLYTSPSPRD